MMLSYAKYHDAVRVQSAIARKILSVIPFDVPMTCNQLASAVFRLTRSQPDFRVLSGCVQDLQKAKIVAEPSPGKYLRVAVPPMPVPAHAPPRAALIPHVQPQAAPTPPSVEVNVTVESEALLDRSAAIATELRALKRTIDEKLTAAAAAIEDAALITQQAIESERAKGAKLIQLTALLKSIGVGD